MRAHLDFNDLGLKSELVESISNYGIDTPTKLLVSVIDSMRLNKNVIAVGHARCGKTVTGIISLLQYIDTRQPTLQAVYMTPTKAQAGNTHRKLVELGSTMRIKSIFSCGGTNQHEDGKMIKTQGIQVLVATPGRLAQFLTRKIVDTRNLRFFLIDKGESFIRFDDMKVDVINILNKLPSTIKYLAFSRVMTAPVEQMLEVVRRNSIILDSPSDSMNFNAADHFTLACSQDEKAAFIARVLNGAPKKVVIYCNSVETLDFLEGFTEDSGLETFKIFESIPGPQLFSYLKNMSKGRYSVVLATNKLKFAIDVTQVDFVIDYELPRSNEEMFERYSSKFVGKRRGKFIHLGEGRDLDSLIAYGERQGFRIQELPDDLIN